jgi:hypothetical protein
MNKQPISIKDSITGCWIKRVVHIVLRALFILVSFAWLIRIVHFLFCYPWSLEGIKNEMSDSAWSSGFETWEQTIRLHIVWVIVTLVIIFLFVLTKTKRFSTKSNDMST